MAFMRRARTLYDNEGSCGTTGENQRDAEHWLILVPALASLRLDSVRAERKISRNAAIVDAGIELDPGRRRGRIPAAALATTGSEVREINNDLIAYRAQPIYRNAVVGKRRRPQQTQADLQGLRPRPALGIDLGKKRLCVSKRWRPPFRKSL